MKKTKIIATGAKYHNKVVEYDGLLFDSMAEKSRYIHLLNMQSKGLISGLMCHKNYVIVPKSQFGNNLIYTPDFVYRQNGKTIVEDVKGGTATLTESSKLRMRLFAERYGIEVKIVTK